jgi:hypothetical protein
MGFGDNILHNVQENALNKVPGNDVPQWAYGTFVWTCGVEGRRGDGYLLSESKVIPELYAIHEELGMPFCVYGDLAYRIGLYVQCAFKRPSSEGYPWDMLNTML